MTLKRSSDIAGGSSFFKPAEYATAVAVLIEPKSVERDVPNVYAGVSKPRDEVTADISVFFTEAALDTGVPTVLKGMTVTHSGITNKLSRAIGEAVVGVLGKKQFEKSPAPAWVVEDIDDTTYAKVAAYYEAREAKVAEALASVPAFD